MIDIAFMPKIGSQRTINFARNVSMGGNTHVCLNTPKLETPHSDP